MQSKTRDRSPNYPAAGLGVAIAAAKTIYDADRRNWVGTDVAVRHLGFTSLNGASRNRISALKQYGLVEYKAGGHVRLTDLALATIIPHNREEYADSLRQALVAPRVFRALLEQYPNWSLPSEPALRAYLIRQLGFTERAVGEVISSLKESLEFVSSHSQLLPSSLEDAGGEEGSGHAFLAPSTAPEVTRPSERPFSNVAPVEGQRLFLPGRGWHVFVPENLSAEEARLMTRWLEKVVKPMLDFVASEGVSDGDH